MDDDPQAVVDYWLDEVGPDGWYAGGEALDGVIRDRWGTLWTRAHGGGLDHWVAGPLPVLAYMIVTDQFPRNIHRGGPLAFATDARARAAARRAVAEGWDMAVPEPERQFMYLPFEHSEDPEDQALSVRLFAERLPGSPDNLIHARAHEAVIGRFGRFPFRNAALGRASTAEEAAWLAEGGYMALVRQMGG
ncbi:MAG TPA: DUF924 family protein [Paracoccaceae bacterium]|mgnify:CR=1 FL=1|nr:DUF924 family protein [Paracoccaceae bacterium]HMO70686.1 DUF924 family protein [Paracoccaceae bacterium]